jgi:hypothetical protein
MLDEPILEDTTNEPRFSRPLENGTIMPTAGEEPPATFNSSSVATGTPVVSSNGNLTAMDLVRRMQQRSAGTSPVSQRSPESKLIQPSFPSVYNTPFAPTPSEQAQLSPRLAFAQKRSLSFTTPQPDSSATFRENIAQQQKEIQARSSPQASFQPTPSWFGQTPSGLDTLFRQFENQQDRTPSPFGSSVDQSTSRGPQLKTTSQQAPYGVIGQRPTSRGTPTSEQGQGR